MEPRKGISKKTRFEVFKRDSFTCQTNTAEALADAWANVPAFCRLRQIWELVNGQDVG